MPAKPRKLCQHGGVAIANQCAIVNLVCLVNLLQRSLFSTAGSFGKVTSKSVPLGPKCFTLHNFIVLNYYHCHQMGCQPKKNIFGELFSENCRLHFWKCFIRIIYLKVTVSDSQITITRFIFSDRKCLSDLPSDTKLLLTKNYFEIIIFGKITNLTRNSSKMSFFPGHFESSKALKNYKKKNSQGIIFVIISCQRVNRQKLPSPFPENEFLIKRYRAHIKGG